MHFAHLFIDWKVFPTCMSSIPCKIVPTFFVPFFRGKLFFCGANRVNPWPAVFLTLQGVYTLYASWVERIFFSLCSCAYHTARVFCLGSKARYFAKILVVSLVSLQYLPVGVTRKDAKQKFFSYS